MFSRSSNQMLGPMEKEDESESFLVSLDERIESAVLLSSQIRF